MAFGDFYQNQMSHQQFFPCIDNIEPWIKRLEEKRNRLLRGTSRGSIFSHDKARLPSETPSCLGICWFKYFNSKCRLAAAPVPHIIHSFNEHSLGAECAMKTWALPRKCHFDKRYKQRDNGTVVWGRSGEAFRGR